MNTHLSRRLFSGRVSLIAFRYGKRASPAPAMPLTRPPFVAPKHDCIETPKRFRRKPISDLEIEINNSGGAYLVDNNMSQQIPAGFGNY